MESPYVRVGLQIKRLRQSRNLSQAQLAEAADISTSHLSQIEVGKRNFGIDILIRLSEALKVSADLILQTNHPEAKESYGQQIAEILSDYPASDAARVIPMMQEMLNAMAESRREELESK